MRTFLKQKNNRAFTLIEALVAVSIFTTSILAMMGVLSNNLADINYAKRRVVATYLAQEGIEYFRNMRDTFALYDQDQRGWEKFLVKTAPCEKTQGSSGCYFVDEMDYRENDSPITSEKISIKQCLDGICPPLTYNATTGAYDYTGLSDSGFTRLMLTSIVNDHEIEVSSVVYFTYRGVTKEVAFSTNLLNWQQDI